MNKFLIASVIGIITVLTVVFLSRQAYFQQIGGNVISSVADKTGAYLAKGANWVVENVYYPKIRVGVESGGEAIQNGINQGVQNISDAAKNSVEKIGNYFSGIKNSILNPGTPQNCPASTVQ